MLRTVFVAFLPILWQQKAVNCNDLYSSMAEMKKLYKHESTLMEKVDSHLEAVDEQIKALDMFLELFKDHNYTELDAEEYVSNPLNTYAMIKRQALTWPKVRNRLFLPQVKQFYCGGATKKHLFPRCPKPAWKSRLPKLNWHSYTMRILPQAENTIKKLISGQGNRVW